MNKKTNHKWLWLLLIAGSFIALALAVTFLPETLNRPIGQGPATWALVASVTYLVLNVSVMALAIFLPGRYVGEENQ